MTSVATLFSPAPAAFTPVHRLVASACSQHAGRVAIERGADRVTYQALADCVNALRARLVAHGIGRDAVVAVLGHRSIEAITAALAVWSEGGTVVLVDAALPAHRRALMFDTAQVSALLRCSPDVPGDTAPVCLDVDGTCPASPTATPIAPDQDRAYLAFTSGSTGRPKAIVGSHTGLSHFLQWQRDTFSVGPGDRFAHLTNLSFDVWFRDVLTPLVSGATVCIPTTPHPGAEAIFRFFDEQGITATHLVPSITNLWLHTHPPKHPIASLRRAFFAGEPLEGVLVRLWRQHFPASEVMNLYGPTETTLAKHCKRLPADVPDGVQPVGPNLPGSMTWLVADDGLPCPAGEVGEVCIATRYRSHGYLTESGPLSPFVEGLLPDLTDIPLYRTGDLGRRNADGDLEIVGRKDDQIKVNGVRIDLLEVKSVIASRPGVRDVFVCARQGRFTKSIVAFVECDAAVGDTLLEAIRTRLPAVMVPARLHVEQELPRLPNGKIDRRGLTDRAQQTAAAPLPPLARDATTLARVTRAWAELLDRAHVPTDRNFFDLGGNSLSLVALHGQLQQGFGVTLPLVRLFQDTTVEAQVRLLESLSGRPGAPTPATADGPDHARQADGRRRAIAARQKPRLAHPSP